MISKFSTETSTAHQLVAQLYDAIGCGRQMKAALTALGSALGASTLVVFSLAVPETGEPEHYLVDGVSRRAMVEYQEHFHRYDPWLKAAQDAGLKPGQWCCGHELVTPAELDASYFGRDFLAWQGLHDVLSGFLDLSSDCTPRLGFLSFHRRVEQGFFSNPSKVLFQDVLPHCQRVLKLHRRLAPQLALGRTLREFFHDTETAMFYVSRDGHLLESNVAAKRYLDRRDAIAEMRPDSEPGLSPRMAVRTGDGWISLGDTLSHLGADHGPSLTLELAGVDGEWQTLAVRRVFTDGEPFEATHSALFALCTLRRNPQREKLEEMALRFKLTPSEAETVRLLNDGKSPRQIAQATGVRITTVRTHLSKAMAKTGTGRQAQLLALVARMESQCH